jgi:hypothetical protein
MKLHEELIRIQTLMESDRSDKRRDQILKMIHENGLFDTAKLFGGFDKLRTLTNDEIPKDIILEEITNILSEKGLLGLGEGNWEEPIYFRGDGEHEHQIVFLGHRKVTIEVVGSSYNVIDEYSIMYLNLPTKILLKICQIIDENIDYLQ